MEIIVRMKSDHIKVKDGEYVRDLVRCNDCKIKEDCPLRLIANLEYCSIGEKE